jgi:isopentenyl-diphosphate delta-isomerase
MPDAPPVHPPAAPPVAALAVDDPEAIVLVDEQDRPVGYAAKLPPHQDGGRLHRAFSVFLFDAGGRMLLQRRALGKYHFGGLWTNACCSHPRRGQLVAAGAAARLRYELGIAVPLSPLLTFIYRAHDPVSGLTEHELDHVFVGRFDGTPTPNPAEVMDLAWVAPADLLADVARRPERFTPWFKVVLGRVLDLRVR